jgi:hypothetical protein
MRVLVALVVLLGIALVIDAVAARRALACSNPTYDLAKDADVIVEGRYLSYQVGSPHPVTFTSPKNGETVVRGELVTETIGFAVSRTLKGSINGTTLTIVNEAWIGGPPSGSCGSAPSDPTGKYSIAGFLRRDDGTFDFYGSFFFGDEPGGEAYQQAVERLLLPTDEKDSSFNRFSPAFGVAGAVVVAALLVLSIARQYRKEANEAP